jgi:hypothetical protein
VSDSAASGDSLVSSRQPAGGGASTTEGGGRSAAEVRRAMLLRHMANPDDPDLPRPPSDARGPRPGPDDRGALGRVAIVQAQVYLVGAIVIAQLFLITTALHELLSGNTSTLWWIALASLIGFLLALLIAVWPRRRVKGF